MGGWSGNNFVFVDGQRRKKLGPEVDRARAICDFYARGGTVTVCPPTRGGERLPHYDEELAKKWRWGRGKK